MKFVLISLVVSVVALGAQGLTECQRQRELNLAVKTNMKLIPKCTENGDYEALQCFEGTPFCMCLKPNGEGLVQPSSKIKSCNCLVHREREVSRHLIGNYVPQCNEDGTYASEQCHGSTGYCWCADEEGRKITDPQRGGAQNC